MTPRVKKVKPKNDYILEVDFTNGEKKFFDVKPYLNKGSFIELKDLSFFNTVKVIDGAVQWLHEQDLSPDTLYYLGN
jgi:hypothetical protein